MSMELAIMNTSFGMPACALRLDGGGGTEVYDELHDLFAFEFLPENSMSDYYPFGGKELYSLESRRSTMHTNSERLAWVRRKLADD